MVIYQTLLRKNINVLQFASEINLESNFQLSIHLSDKKTLNVMSKFALTFPLTK